MAARVGYRRMRWLAECSVAALREALGGVAPELAGYPVTVPGPAGQAGPAVALGLRAGR